MIVVSTRQIYSGAEARTPSFWGRGVDVRARPTPASASGQLVPDRGSGEHFAETLGGYSEPIRPRMASRPVGTCRYSGASTISFIARIAAAVSGVAVSRGQLGWSSRPQVCSVWRQRW